MGLFDGHHDVTLKTSTADVAKHVGAPVILVTDASRMAASAGALALGFRTFDSEIRLAGVILNRWRPGRKKAPVEAALARAGVETLGYIPAADDVALPSRHLGLVVADEVADQTAATMALLGEFVEQHVDVDRVLAIAGEAPDLGVLDLGTQGAKAPGSKGPAPGAHADGTNSDGAHPDWSHTDEVYSGGTYPDGVSPDGKYRGLRIAVAWDAAFAFYYADNLDLLRAKGVEVVPFSPLSAAELPVCDGLYLGGGYPELHAQALSMNEALRSNLTAAIAAQLPTYAECGGLVYLCESLTDLDGRTWPLVGALPAAATMHSRLQALGYREARLHGDSLLGPAGAVVRGHEFHYASCDLTPAASPAYWVDGSPEATPPATSLPHSSICISRVFQPLSITGLSAAWRTPANDAPEVQCFEQRPHHSRSRESQPRRRRAVHGSHRPAQRSPERPRLPCVHGAGHPVAGGCRRRSRRRGRL